MVPYTTQRTFSSTRIILTRHDENYTLAVCDTDGTEIIRNELSPPEYCPKAPLGTLEVKDPIRSDLFIKYPRLKVWHPMVKDVYLRATKEETMREVTFCEVLRHSPHPNLASYQGCIVKDGLIRGICYSRYEKTLAQAVNPCLWPKNDFQYGAYPLPCERDLFMSSLRADIAHIHSLGYVHCDVKPENVMLRPDGAAVVIDFNSCVLEASPLKVARTCGWHDLEADYAEPEDDDDAVDDIAEWLSDKEVKKYWFLDEASCARWYKSRDEDP